MVSTPACHVKGLEFNPRWGLRISHDFQGVNIWLLTVGIWSLYKHVAVTIQTCGCVLICLKRILGPIKKRRDNVTWFQGSSPISHKITHHIIMYKVSRLTTGWKGQPLSSSSNVYPSIQYGGTDCNCRMSGLLQQQNTVHIHNHTIVEMYVCKISRWKSF